MCLLDGRLCTVVLSVTKHFNESNQFAGDKEKMAYVVREPIVRGMVIIIHTQANVSVQMVAFTSQYT